MGMTAAYRPELFEHVDLPDGVDATLFLDFRSIPVKFALNPGSTVAILCNGDIRTTGPGGFRMVTHDSGTFTFDVWGQTYQTLNGPLILDAADRLGIDVPYECAPGCPHRYP